MNDDIMRSLGRIEANQQNLHEEVAGVRNDLGGLGLRVRHLESFRNWVAGVGAAFLAIVGWLSKGG